MNEPSAVDKKAGILFDLLADRDMSTTDILTKTGWDNSTLSAAVQRLRDTLRDGDITVPCDPQGSREPWLYQLMSGKYVVDEESTGWVPNRVKDTERRIRTMTSVLQTAVNATDGRSTLGRKAKVMLRHLERVIEDLAFLDENG